MKIQARETERGRVGPVSISGIWNKYDGIVMHKWGVITDEVSFCVCWWAEATGENEERRRKDKMRKGAKGHKQRIRHVASIRSSSSTNPRRNFHAWGGDISTRRGECGNKPFAFHHYDTMESMDIFEDSGFCV